MYLYKEDGQPDNAVKTMVEHPIAFQHELFLDCIQKARNQVRTLPTDSSCCLPIYCCGVLLAWTDSGVHVAWRAT